MRCFFAQRSRRNFRFVSARFFQLFHMARRTDMCFLIDERFMEWLPTRRGVYDSTPI